MFPTVSRRFVVLASVVAFALTAWSFNVSATSVIFSNLERMINISDYIVQGEVVSQRTYVSDALSGQVITTTTIKTDRVFFGPKQETFSFTQWGGNYNGQMAHIPGDANFEIGENVIVFLATPKHANEKGFLFLSLLGQSKYEIAKLGGKRIVTRKLTDISFVDPATTTYEKHENEVFDYASFVAELETQIAGIKGGKQ